MKTKILLFLLASIFTSINLFSQVTQEWVARYDGSGHINDAGTIVIVDDSGNVYVSGFEGIGGSNLDDFCTIKYDNNGVQQWLRTYNGPGFGTDEVAGMVIDNESNVYVTGKSYSGPTWGYDFCTIKYSASGIQQWVRTYDGPASSHDVPAAIAIDNYKNIIITGSSTGVTSGLDGCTLKYDSLGVLRWLEFFNGSGNNDDAFESLITDSIGNVYVTGYSRNGSAYGTEDYITVKYSINGFQQWAKTYNGNSNGTDKSNCITLDSRGNIVVTGYVYESTSLYDYCTIKYNPAGIQQWVQRYNNPFNRDDQSRVVRADTLGYIYVTGVSYYSGVTPDICTIRYDSNGVQQWIVIYNGQMNAGDEPYCLSLDRNRNVYVAGASRIAGTTTDYCIIKYNFNGAQQWIAFYNGPGNSEDMVRSMTLDSSNNVYVTGYSRNELLNRDICTIKYSQFVGVQPVSGITPHEYYLNQNYPNPFNPMTKIKFSLPNPSEGGAVKLVVYDILGREVAMLVNEQLKPGTYEVEWVGTNYPSGVYFYKLSAGDYVANRKMVLIK